MTAKILPLERKCPAPVRAVPKFGEASGPGCQFASREAEIAEMARIRADSRRQVGLALEALSLPQKEIGLYLDGLDRGRRAWVETQPVRDLRAAVRDSLVVVLWGPVGTGKSAAACRVLAELCRVEIESYAGRTCDEVDVWADGLYLRAPDYARLADWEEDRLEAVWSVRHLVIDDLGEEEHLGDKATARLRLLLTRRDDEIKSGTRTIVTTNLTPQQIGARYSARVFDRLGELGSWIRCDRRVRPTKGQ